MLSRFEDKDGVLELRRRDNVLGDEEGVGKGEGKGERGGDSPWIASLLILVSAAVASPVACLEGDNRLLRRKGHFRIALAGVDVSKELLSLSRGGSLSAEWPLDSAAPPAALASSAFFLEEGNSLLSIDGLLSGSVGVEGTCGCL